MSIDNRHEIEELLKNLAASAPIIPATTAQVWMPHFVALAQELFAAHHPVDEKHWGKYCATCIIDAGATGADNEDWPYEMYMMLEEHLLAPRKDQA